MRKALAVICLAGLLLSGCSVVRKMKESSAAEPPPPAPAPAPAPPKAEETHALTMTATGGIEVNALMATGFTEGPDGYKVDNPHQHTIIAGSPELPTFLVRIDGLSEGQHTVKLQFKIDPAPAEWLATMEKDAQAQTFMKRFGPQLKNGWTSEVTRRFEVTKDPGDWAAHLFINDLLILGWAEGVRQVDIFVDDNLVHQTRVRILNADAVLKKDG